MNVLGRLLDIETEQNERLLNAIMRPWPCRSLVGRLYAWSERQAGWPDPTDERLATVDRSAWPWRCRAADWLGHRFDDFDVAWVQRRRLVGRRRPGGRSV